MEPLELRGAHAHADQHRPVVSASEAAERHDGAAPLPLAGCGATRRCARSSGGARYMLKQHWVLLAHASVPAGNAQPQEVLDPPPSPIDWVHVHVLPWQVADQF